MKRRGPVNGRMQTLAFGAVCATACHSVHVASGGVQPSFRDSPAFFLALLCMSFLSHCDSVATSTKLVWAHTVLRMP